MEIAIPLAIFGHVDNANTRPRQIMGECRLPN